MDKWELAGKIILVAGLIIASVGVIIWATLPFSTLVVHIPDDSFYYYQPASLIAQGFIPSFDGIRVGNGFNPLWMLVLIPIFALKSVDLYLPIHLSLLVAGFFYVFTSFNIYRIMKAFGMGVFISACASVTFGLYSNAFIRVIDGEVTPLNLFVISYFLLTYIKVIRNNRSSTKQLIGLGIWSALAYLSRTDNFILLILMLVYYLISNRKVRDRYRSLGIIALAAFAVTLPWFIYNIIQFHSIVPSSAWAVPAINHARWEGPNPSFVTNMAVSYSRIVEWMYFVLSYSPMYTGIIFFYGVVITWLTLKGSHDHLPAALLLGMLLFLSIIYVLNSGVRWYVRDWHLGSAFLINHLFLWYAIFILLQNIRRINIIILGCTLVLLISSVVRIPISLDKFSYRWQTEMWAGGKWASEHPNIRIGAVNCGILAYFGAGNVVDLDGNMNNDAYKAIEQRKLYNYCKENQIEYILDYDISILLYFNKIWPLQNVSIIQRINTDLDDPNVTINDSLMLSTDPFLKQIEGKYTLFAIN